MENANAMKRLVDLKDKSHIWLSKFGLSKAETEDIFQDALVKAIKSDNLKEDLTNLDGWFYRILTNTALDVVRKRKLISKKENELAEFYLSNSEVEKEICGCISDLIKELAPDDQDVLKQHFFGNKTLKSISQEIGISESTLRVRALRARQRLKDLFKGCCNPESLEDLKDCEC
ncbi:MAG TPA: RNA polymerase sigma factor [Bacteriovoracaceae bacterium]|nr:RNA polymerase sigma factor [Bacteriovoracaceae bacterium]